MKRRIYVEPGIYRERDRFYVVARVGSRKTRELVEAAYFDLDTPLQPMRAWRHRAIADLVEARPVYARTGTLAGDIEPFLDTVEAGPKSDDLRWLLQHWIDSPLSALPRQHISREQILAQRKQWLDQGAAASTVNHRVRALRALYNALDGGPDAPHPTDKITRIPPPPPEPRGIPMAYVAQILAAMPDRGRAERFGERPTVSVTKIRLTIIAYTGIPHAQLKRLRPRDVDFEGKRVYLQPRRKGKGAAGVWLALQPEAVTALRAFGAANLWGKPFSRASMRKSWLGAIRRVTRRLERTDRAEAARFRHAIPPNCRPYDLRHSFATEAYRVSGDPRAVAELLQHSDLAMMSRYTGGAVSERVTAVIAKMTEASQRTPTPPPAKKIQPRGQMRIIR